MLMEGRQTLLFMNVGHFLDHFFVLIFATAALHLSLVWGLSYAELIPYATPSFVAFAVGALPAGWLADHWSREKMMVLFFIGLGCSALLAGGAEGPLELSIALAVMGLFASIYHPVGLAIVAQQQERIGFRIAINGIFGNLGVASAALVTGILVDTAGWQSAFTVPGLLSITIGIFYLRFILQKTVVEQVQEELQGKLQPQTSRKVLLRTFGVILLTSALGGLIFQSTTFSLPKILDERLVELAGTHTLIGSYTFLIFAAAAFGQLVVGYLLDRYPLRTVFALVALLQATLFGAMIQQEGIVALLVALAFMLVVFGQVPINDVLIGRMIRSEWRSRAYALRSIITFSVMASAVPLILNSSVKKRSTIASH